MKNIWRIFWKNIEKIGLVTSILFSMIALFISVRSCGDSREALEISKKEFESKRLLVLQSNDSYMSPGFNFGVFDSNQKLQQLVIELPKNIFKEKIIIESPDFHFSLVEIQDSLKILIHKYLHGIKEKDFLLIKSFIIPIIIKTNFVAGGESLWDTSLYNLEFSFQLDHLNNLESYIEFKSLIFVNRLVEDDYEERQFKLSNIFETSLRNSVKND
jgi:hypothetical protein